jgi:CRISPR-associated endonuclease/helicase Cas3
LITIAVRGEGGTMAEVAPFELFFAAVHNGLVPLPWQRRLARLVAEEGWPDRIGVPTGLGKTACIDVALWVLAGQTNLAPAERSVATRIWYVVNRRLLVDAATAHGERVAGLLAHPESLIEQWPQAGAEHTAVLRAVGAALASMATLGVADGPLHVARLRGGAELGARSPDASQPTLVFATVPMFASRWMFRGYGTSVSMRPVDAALAGLDTLVLLDEAHLAAALSGLVEPLSACDPGDPGRLLAPGRSRPRLVALTATGANTANGFDLDDEDLAHPVVRERLDAPKPTRLVETTKKALAATLAASAAELTDDARRSSCLVFANTPARARAVHSLLADKGGEQDLVLVTGRMRDREADVIRARLLNPTTGVPAGRTGPFPERPLVVVATQTLEVGADLDVDALVTETAGVRAVVQRFGRLNRLGTFPEAAAVICHAPDLVEPLYGEEPAGVWRRLSAADQPVVLSPAVISTVLGPPADAPARGAEPLPGLVWEWAKTSVAPPGEAPTEAYYAPDDQDVTRVAVCWRAHRPAPGVALNPPITAGESIDIPIWELREVFSTRGLTGVSRLTADRASLESVTPDRMRPGDVVVLDANDGLYDQFGWNPDATEPVLDSAILHAGVLPLTTAVFANLVADHDDRAGLDSLLADLEAAEADDGPVPGYDETWVVKVLDALRAARPHAWVSEPEWATFCSRLRGVVVRPVGDVAYLPTAPSARQRQATVRADAFDQLSFDATSVSLREHLGSVGEAAGLIARRVGLPAEVVAAVEAAGRWHDLGKLDSRFQRWLDPKVTATQPLAKSSLSRYEIEAARIAAGWPRGGRHEAISVQLVHAWLAGQELPDMDDDLVIHLVVSHHGHGRPTVPVAADETNPHVDAVIDGTTVRVRADLASPDWTQPARFRRLCERYGYWGLAFLETVLRQADQAASSAVVA